MFKDVAITYTPILLGGVMKACDNRAPLEIKNKDKWIDRDRQRWARAFDIPIASSAPDGFPVSTLAPMRALTALRRTNPDKLVPATDALYAAIWGPARNKDEAHKPEGLARVLASVLGADETKRVMAEMGTDANKKALLDSVNEAVAEGAFGVPYFIVTGADGKRETYWGFNSLGLVIEQLGLTRDTAQGGWRALL